MNDTNASTGGRHGPGQYEIRLAGHLADRWALWFGGMSITPEDDGTTVLQGVVVDQAALHGLLQKVRDLGLPLVSVTQVDDQPDTAPVTPLAHNRPSQEDDDAG